MCMRNTSRPEAGIARPAMSSPRLPSARLATTWACLFILSTQSGCAKSAVPCPGESFDAGPVFVTSTNLIRHRFEVTNTTDCLVRILGKTQSCSYTAANLPRETLKPGESAWLDVEVRVPDGYARLAPAILINTDHPSYPEWRYQIRAEVFPTSRIDPPVVDLGVRSPGRVAPEGSGGGTETPQHAWLECFAPDGASPPLPVRIECRGGG